MLLDPLANPTTNRSEDERNQNLKRNDDDDGLVNVESRPNSQANTTPVDTNIHSLTHLDIPSNLPKPLNNNYVSPKNKAESSINLNNANSLSAQRPSINNTYHKP